jgi:SPP1 family predicted phage head-tail adaptor
MRAGARDSFITIQSAARVVDAAGAPFETWTTFATAWAQIKTGGGTEFQKASEIHSELTHLITMRHAPGITTGMRVEHSGRIFNILAAYDPLNNRVDLKLVCNEI